MSVKTNATIKGFRVAFYYGINVMTRPKYLLHALCSSGAGDPMVSRVLSCLGQPQASWMEFLSVSLATVSEKK